jgi:L-lactate dehydrogenase complex protein LldE
VFPEQTCCGQPAYNSGDRANARALAERVIDAFAGCDYVVVPSGSCAGMLRRHYPTLFDAERDGERHAQAQELAGRTRELTEFLDERGVRLEDLRFDGTVTYHDGCSGLRELGVYDQPRRLLKQVAGLTLSEAAGGSDCCGFGGTFCVKYPEISTRMVSDKCHHLVESGADTVLAGDLGCLLNIAGRLSREGHPVRARHVAEVLAGMTDEPALGDSATEFSSVPVSRTTDEHG